MFFDRLGRPASQNGRVNNSVGLISLQEKIKSFGSVDKA